jgi:hypothetical protein
MIWTSREVNREEGLARRERNILFGGWLQGGLMMKFRAKLRN